MNQERKKPPIIAVTYQKGGLGKTTVSVNLSTMLAWKGYRVLIIDGCRHTGATSYFTIRDESKVGFYDVITGNCTLDEAITKIQYSPSGSNRYHYDSFELDAVPAYFDIGTQVADIRLVPNWEYLLKDAISQSDKIYDYDYIIIDCPPADDIFLTLIYTAAEYFILPMFPDAQSLINLGITHQQIYSLAANSNEKQILGCIVINYEKDNLSGAEIINQLRTQDYVHCFQSIIPHLVSYDDSFKCKMPFIVYWKEYGCGRPVCFPFMSFADEVISIFEGQ